MTGSGQGAGAIEKLMAIRADEFEAGLARLAGAPVHRGSGGSPYIVKCSAPPLPAVRITFEAMPEQVLGGLLKLPRARVIIEMPELSTDQRRVFISAFDRTFQRGGG